MKKLSLFAFHGALSFFTGWEEERDRKVTKNGKKDITPDLVFLKKVWREQQVVLPPTRKVLQRL